MADTTRKPINGLLLKRIFGRVTSEIGGFALVGFIAAIGLLALFANLSEEVFSQEFTKFDTTLALNVHSWANPTLDFILISFLWWVALLG